MNKLAKLKTKLKEHQQRVVDRLEDEDQPGLVAVHGLGSGKTLTSIAVADALGLPADVVTPAALQENYRKELKKHVVGKAPKTDLHTLEAVARRGGENLRNPLLIVDEAHRIRNAGKARTGVKWSPAEKRLALTGSLLYNHPSDIAGPINFAAGHTVLPEDPDQFADRFLVDVPRKQGLMARLRGVPAVYDTRLRSSQVSTLRNALDKYVDYHPGSPEGFPEREDQVVKVPMARDQMKLYSSVIGELPPALRRKVLMNLPPNKQEAKDLNAYMTGVRQVSNTTRGFDLKLKPQEPKIEKAISELQSMLDQNPRAKALVYSSFLDSGVNPYQEHLKRLKVPFGAFTGDMSRKAREQMVRDYNDDKIKALLLSPAGGEGLDLKGTRLIQILEPHFNEEKLKQVIGRGIRYKSHEHLPEDERKVLVQRFLATRAPEGLAERMGLREPGYAADEYLDELSQRKERLNEQVRRLLRNPA